MKTQFEGLQNVISGFDERETDAVTMLCVYMCGFACVYVCVCMYDASSLTLYPKTKTATVLILGMWMPHTKSFWLRSNVI